MCVGVANFPRGPFLTVSCAGARPAPPGHVRGVVLCGDRRRDLCPVPWLGSAFSVGPHRFEWPSLSFVPPYPTPIHCNLQSFTALSKRFLNAMRGVFCSPAVKDDVSS